MDLVASFKPPTLATERILALSHPLAALVPEGGLVRGRSWSCQGDAAASVAIATVADAVRAGSWIAVVDAGWFGLEAADEFGLSLERLVAVQSEPGPGGWGSTVAAAIDGFDIVVTTVAPNAGDHLLRTIRARLQARGSVLVDVERAGSHRCGGWHGDVVAEATTIEWGGIGTGWGHLGSRRVQVALCGRRMPGRATTELWMPDAHGEIRPARIQLEAHGHDHHQHGHVDDGSIELAG